MTTALPEFTDLLRRAGLRVTAARLAVLAALAESGAHPDADAVAGAARARLGTLSTQAVYDVLRALVEAGLVRRIEPAGGPARFETRVGDNHHHLVCRACGKVVDVDCPVAAAPCMEPASTDGFSIDEAEVTFWGHCPACITATPASSAESRWTRSVRHSLGNTAWDPEPPRSRANSHQRETPREEEDRHG